MSCDNCERLERELKTSEAELSAWHSQFGYQLSHAVCNKETAERALAAEYAKTAALQNQFERAHNQGREATAMAKQYVSDLSNAATAIAALTEQVRVLREGVLNAIKDEEELDGDMPDAVYVLNRTILGTDYDRKKMTEILRAVVRTTKNNICNRVAALAATDQDKEVKQ